MYNRNCITKSNHVRHQTQTNHTDMKFSTKFTGYIKNIQHQKLQRANLKFTNDVFSIIYSYLSIVELKGTQSESPTQTSRHTTLGQKVCIFSRFLISSVKISLVMKYQKILNKIYKRY